MKRIFTESDAARVACYAIRDGGDFELYFEKLEECGGNAFKSFIAKKLEERIKPELCEATTRVDSAIRSKLSRLVAVVNLLSSFSDSLDGLVSDIESFVIAGVRVVPRFLTLPLRRIVDRLQEAVQDINDTVSNLFNELDLFKEYCDGSED